MTELTDLEQLRLAQGKLLGIATDPRCTAAERNTASRLYTDLEEYLSKAKVLFKDFKKFATGLTAEVCQSAEQLTQSLGRPFIYFGSSRIFKEEEAQKIAQRKGPKGS